MEPHHILSATDLQAIENLFYSFHKAWADGDAVTYAGLFWEDAHFVGAPGFRLNGSGIIQKEHEEIFASLLQDTSIDGPYERQLQALTTDVVLVHTTSRVFFAGQSKNVPATGLVVYCLLKKNGHWKIISFQNTPTGNFRHFKFLRDFLISKLKRLI